MADQSLEGRHNLLQPRETPPPSDIVRRNSDEQRNNGGSSTLSGSEGQAKPRDKWGVRRMVQKTFGIGSQTQDRPGTEVNPWAQKRADLTVRSSGIAELNTQSVEENGNIQRKYEELSRRFDAEITPLVERFERIDKKLQSRSNRVHEGFDEVHEQLHDLSRTIKERTPEFQKLRQELWKHSEQFWQLNGVFQKNIDKIYSINDNIKEFSEEIHGRSIISRKSLIKSNDDLIKSNDKLIKSNDKLISTNETRVHEIDVYVQKIDQLITDVARREAKPQYEKQENNQIEKRATRDLDDAHTSIKRILDAHTKRFQEYQKYREEQFDPHCKTVDGNPRFDGNVEETKTRLWEFRESFRKDNSELLYNVKHELTAIQKNLQTSSPYLDREVIDIDGLNATNDSLIKRTESQIKNNEKTLEQMEADKKKYFPYRDYDLGNHFGL